jgi:hypothetical protein
MLRDWDWILCRVRIILFWSGTTEPPIQCVPTVVSRGMRPSAEYACAFVVWFRGTVTSSPFLASYSFCVVILSYSVIIGSAPYCALTVCGVACYYGVGLADLEMLDSNLSRYFMACSACTNAFWLPPTSVRVGNVATAPRVSRITAFFLHLIKHLATKMYGGHEGTAPPFLTCIEDWVSPRAYPLQGSKF